MSWTELRIGDYLTLLTDYHANGAYEKLKKNVVLKYEPDYAVMIRTLNFERVDFKNELLYLNETEYDFLAKSKVQPYDIIMNKIANAGSVYLMPNLNQPVSLAMNLFLLRFDERVEQRFLFYLMKLNEPYIKTFANGSTTKTITKDAVRNLVFKVPHLIAQKKIAGILSAYDDLLDNNRKRIALLEKAARLLYEEWFVRLRFPGHEHTPVVDGVPQGWEKATLKDISYEAKEAIHPNQIAEGTAYIGLEHMPRKSIALQEWGQPEDVNSLKYRFMKGDILFGKIRPYFHKVGITFNSGICSTDAVVLRPTDDKYHKLLLMFVSSEAFVNEATQSSNGTKMPRANWRHLEKLNVLIAPDGILATFSDYIKPLLLQIENIAAQNQKLQQARDLLLPRLMSGELAV